MSLTIATIGVSSNRWSLGIMKPENIVLSLERFYLDLIGVILPGFAFIGCTWFVFGQPTSIGTVPILPISDLFGVLFFIVVAYIAGYAVTSVGETIVMEIAHRLPLLKSRSETAVLVRGNRTFEVALSEICRVYPVFAKMQQEPTSQEPKDISRYVRMWRNIAISIVQENEAIIYRFMAVSQLNLGLASAFFSTAIVWLAAHILNLAGTQINVIPIQLGLFILLLIICLPFLERQQEFYMRALSVPFSMVAVKYSNSVTQAGDAQDRQDSERA
jgi:hypothetical protein